MLKFQNFKKMLSKIVTVTCICLIACAICTCVAGCAGSTYVGHWVCVGVSDGDTEVNVSDLSSIGADGSDYMTIDLNSDGTASMSAFGQSLTEGLSVTWEESDLGVDLKIGKQTVSMEYDAQSSRLSLTYSGQTVYLQKQ